MHPTIDAPPARRAAARLALAAVLVAALPGCGPKDWYYHFNCHGDPECLATNPIGQPYGDLNEGPRQGDCTALQEFSRRFWSAPAVDWCDQSPSGAAGTTTGGGGGGGGGGSPPGPPTISYYTPGGAPGTTIAVTGSNFPTTAAGLTVTICGVTATVSSLTTDASFYGSAVVVVPLVAAGTCDLTVTTAKGSATQPGFPVGNLHQPFALVVDASAVYWTERESGGSVKKVPLAGGAVTTLATGLDQPAWLAQDATALYWSERTAVRKVAKAGGAVTTLVAAAGYPAAVAVQGGNVYYTDQSQTTVTRVPVAGGTPATVVSDCGQAVALAANATSLFYFASTGHLVRAPIGGGASVQLSTALDAGVELALDAASVYWGYGALHRTALDGSTDAAFPDAVSNVEAFEVDATNLYFLHGTSGGTAVGVQPLAGGAWTDLVSGPAAGSTLHLASDAASLYWTDPGLPGVKKAAKATGAVTVLATSPNLP